jgi:aminoglycoside phosphotransferase (APT) family kinase protein
MASVLAVEPGAGWILLADAGPTLTERLDGRFESGLWERMLADFAQLQRRSEPLTAELLAAGVPDERPDRLFAVLNQLLLQSPGLTDLTDAERRTLLGQPERWAEAAAELAQLPIAASVQHGDLHGGNLAIGDDGKARFFDLGDASIAHPFTTMLVPLQVARSLNADDGQLDRLRDSYLEVFTDLATPVQLRRGLDLALRSAALPKATAWDRALRFATAGHPWGEPVLEYVRDLL